MNLSPRCRCGARSAGPVVLALLLAVTAMRAADGPGGTARAAMMKAWQAGTLDDAIAALETALKLDPTHALASRELQKLKG